MFYLIKNLILSIILLPQICNGHIFMHSPPSRHNLYSEYYVSNNLVNYDLRSPLNASPDFFTFPCKGFSVGPPTYTFNSNQISITLEGTATHGGGHCQFGISYDNQNFVVLKTVLKTCLLDTMTFTFDLPSNAPDGNLIVFWTWINRIGNREYYMECADVNIVSNNINNGQLTGKDLFIANLPGYPHINEWTPDESPDNTGETQILQMNEKTIYKNSNIQSSEYISQTTTSTLSTLSTLSTSEPAPTPTPSPSPSHITIHHTCNDGDSCNVHGQYTCSSNSNHVLQCVYGKYVIIDSCDSKYQSSKCVLISDIPYCI